MKKSIRESEGANTKAGKQASTMSAGKHRKIKQAPENKLLSKLAKKTLKQESGLTIHLEIIYIFIPASFELPILPSYCPSTELG